MSKLCCPTVGEGDQQIWMYPRLVVERTYVVLAVSSILVLIVCIIVGTAGHLGLTEESGYDWVISDVPASMRWDGYNDARNKVDELSQEGDEVSVADEALHRGLLSNRNNLLLLWHTKDDTDIFTPANLQGMCNVEQIVMGHPDYELKFCQLNYAPEDTNADHSHNDECKDQGASILTFFYEGSGTSRTGCPLLSQADVDTAKGQITNPAFFAQTAFFLGSDILDRGFTAYARSIITLGGPIAGCDGTLSFISLTFSLSFLSHFLSFSQRDHRRTGTMMSTSAHRTATTRRYICLHFLSFLSRFLSFLSRSSLSSLTFYVPR